MFFYLIILLLLLLLVDWWKPRNLVNLHRQLGTEWTYLPLIGHAYKFIGSNEDVFKAFVNGASQAYRKKDGTTSIWLGNKLIIGIADPIQSIGVLKSAFDKTFIYHFMKYIMGNGIIFAPVELWHRRRKILTPTFAPRHVSKFTDVFQDNAKILVDELEKEIGKGNFSCWTYICRYSLDSVGETILGVKVGALKEPDNPCFVAYQEYFKSTAARICKPWLHVDLLYQCLPEFSKSKKTKNIIYDFIDNIIQGQKISIQTDSNTNNVCNNNDLEQNGKKFKIFLELINKTSIETDKAYTHEELREESLGLVFAGTDTSATAISFAIVLLSQHQEVQEKVYKEIQEVLGKDNRAMVYEDLVKFKYLEAVIKETLRLYPPIPLIMRDSKNDYKLVSGLTIPKNCDVVINIFGIHRHPDYWGADAEDFIPERFLKEEFPPGAFMAFSTGPRNCLGHFYAMLSLKTTLVTILRRYRLLPATSFKYDKNNPLKLTYEIMLKHVDNFEIQVEYRNKEEEN